VSWRGIPNTIRRISASTWALRKQKSDPILVYSTGAVYAAMGKRTEAIKVIKELEAMSGAGLDQCCVKPP
jgi:hypothetical protein